MIPLVGMAVVPTALLAVLAGWLLPVAEPALWRLAAWPLQQVLPVAGILAERGGDWWYRPVTAPLPVVLLAALGIALLVLPLSLRARIPAALLVLPLLLPPDPAASALAPGLTRVTVLDVGQGTAVVVRAGDRTLVYDTGGGDPTGANMANSVLLPYLRAQGVRALDTLVISHPDTDHSAGAGTLLAALPAGQVYAGGGLPGPAEPCLAGQAWDWPGGQQFRFLSPAPGEVLDSNDSSCVLQLAIGDHRLLLPGDIENARERELVRYWGGALASNWLLVAHHGSLSSSSWAFLKTVRPALAVVSSGYANRFGHPHAEVLGRLEHAGAAVYDTALSGALEFDLVAGEPVRLRRHRAEVRRFWM